MGLTRPAEAGMGVAFYMIMNWVATKSFGISHHQDTLNYISWLQYQLALATERLKALKPEA